MKVLVLGAGAVGGYFGGRLVEKGADVTFLVRERRKQQLEEHGLIIKSIHGDFSFAPKLLVAGEASEPFDLVILTTKAYHFADGVESIRPYVGEDTMVLPLLNGMAHVAALQEAFGRERVIGGLCFIESTLNAEGDVIQTSPVHEMLYGEWTGGSSSRMEQLAQLFAGANASYRASDNIQREMWHKYLFITTLSGMTTLMNSAVGPIRDAADGVALTQQLFGEVADIMRKSGASLADDIVERHMKVFNKQGYAVKSSMLRDMEKGQPVEADHLQGYLLDLAKQNNVEAPLLRTIYNKLKVYEINRSLL
ncbi:2-dehydropantoate 2-reductase [Brevibacillus fluminis]|uniref:2-dehydropantoate 2-reductase n=1 Tax=Brevibacillus fluminis TaxID=511487 RepID=A0A3M8DF09_9BACL|nr:2-dehydropantoate 2-reductase [Brevibacillus fluminis]RNB85915.1 2-dehydropantoate 2-reductase [Brevibacillus fluminis]